MDYIIKSKIQGFQRCQRWSLFSSSRTLYSLGLLTARVCDVFTASGQNLVFFARKVSLCLFTKKTRQKSIFCLVWVFAVRISGSDPAGSSPNVFRPAVRILPDLVLDPRELSRSASKLGFCAFQLTRSVYRYLRILGSWGSLDPKTNALARSFFHLTRSVYRSISGGQYGGDPCMFMQKSTFLVIFMHESIFVPRYKTRQSL